MGERRKFVLGERLQLLGLVGVLLWSAVLRGEANAAFRFLETADQAAQARYETLQGASQEILQMTFVFKQGRFALWNAALLREKARQGAKVYLLIDAHYAKMTPTAVLKHLADSGVQIKFFNPFHPTRPFQYQYRMHDKGLLVDGRLLVAGGRNVGDQYFGLSESGWRDLELHIDSEAVGKQMRDHFFRNWKDPQSVVPDWKGVTAQEVSRAAKDLDAALEDASTNPHLHPPGGSHWNRGKLYHANADFIGFRFDEQGKRLSHPREIARLLEGAKDRIDFVTPFFAPPKELERILARKAAEGVKVRIVTNAQAINHQRMVARLYSANLRRYAKLGFEMVEMNEAFTHTKALVVDDTAMVGTLNGDAISWLKNSEVGVVIPSREVATDLRALIDRAYVMGGKVVAKDGRLAPGADVSCRLWQLTLWPLRNHL